jgi:hypothetical protein
MYLDKLRAGFLLLTIVRKIGGAMTGCVSTAL